MDLMAGRKPPMARPAGAPPPTHGAHDLPDMPPVESDGDAPDHAGASGDQAKKAWNYIGAEQHCGSCQHFDGDSTCTLGKFPVTEDGHCDKFKAGAEEGKGGDYDDLGEGYSLGDLEEPEE